MIWDLSRLAPAVAALVRTIDDVATPTPEQLLLRWSKRLASLRQWSRQAGDAPRRQRRIAALEAGIASLRAILAGQPAPAREVHPVAARLREVAQVLMRMADEIEAGGAP